MRNLNYIVGAVVVSALVGITAATAADLPVRTYTKAPVYVDPGFNWNGFYVGGNIGYSWGRSSNTETISTFATSMASSAVASSAITGKCPIGWWASKETSRAAARGDLRPSLAWLAATAATTSHRS